MTLFKDQDDQDSVDPNKNYLDELVGEDKKFKTPEELARGKAEADAFVERLKSELSGLRQELSTRLKLEEVVDRISKQPPSSEPEPKAPEQGDLSAILSPEKVKEMVAQTISDSEKAGRRQRNMALVEQKLQEAFGPTFRRTVKNEAQQLGLGEDFLNNLAAEQPTAFLKLFNVTPQPEVNSTATSAPRSQVNSEALGFRPDSSVRRKSYYDNLRKTKPSDYWSVSVQNEIHREAHKQGPSFFDR